MDYTLLIAVHPLTIVRAKMNTRQEQEYYERAAARQAMQEKPLAVLRQIGNLAAKLMTLTVATGKGLGHSMAVRKALH